MPEPDTAAVRLRLQPMIHVHDMAASVAFYERLGGQLRHGSRDGDWALIVIDSAEISLLAHPPNPDQNEGIVELNFEAEDDLEQIQSALTSGEVEIVQPVRDTDFGRQLQIRSPDGLLIKINTVGPDV